MAPPPIAGGASRTGRFFPPFFGWRVVAALFVMLMCSSGFGFYNQSVLLEALIKARPFSVSKISLGSTIFFLMSGLFGVGVAWLIERYDIRWPITLGAVLTAVSLGLIGRVTELWQLYAAFALFGVGFSTINMVSATTLVVRWFHNRRPLALAITATGLSVGGIVVTPVAAQLVEDHGLERGTLLSSLLLLVGVVPLVWLFVRDRPEAMGLRPDGETNPDALTTPEDAPPTPKIVAHSVPFRKATRSRFFAFVTLAYVFGLMAQVGGLTHQFNLITERADRDLASLGLVLLATGSIVGRFAASLLVSRWSTRGVAIFLVLAQGAALLGLGQASSSEALLTASAALGLTVGSFLLMRPLLLAEAFGVLNYPSIYSVLNLLASLGVAAGPGIVGALYDQFGGYGPALQVLAVASAVAALMLAVAGPTKRTMQQDLSTQPT